MLMAKKKANSDVEKVVLESTNSDKFTQRIEKEIEKEFGDGIFNSANTILDNPKMTIPVSPALDMVLNGGIPEGSWVICSGPPKCGKAQPLDSIVYTPDGPVTIGSLKVGDDVCRPEDIQHASTTKVEGIYPQGEKDIFEITFDNGDTARSCGDHLWEVCKNVGTRIVSLIDYINGKFQDYQYVKTSFCHFNRKEVPIEPFIIGVLLGAGYIHDNGRIRVIVSDRETIEKIRETMPASYEFIPVDPDSPDLFEFVPPTDSDILLKELNDLGYTTTFSFIPKNYIYNTFECRLDLISGLVMSSTGSLSDFIVDSEQLAKDIKEVFQSIGKIVYLKKEKRRDEWHVHVDLDTRLRKIVKIEQVGKAECVCIRVAYRRGLYVTDNFIRTHNTTTGLSFAANVQKPEYGGRHVYYLDIEGRIKAMNISGINGLQLDKFTLIQSKKGKILTAENFLTIAEKIIRDHPGCLLILDSSSALCAEKEMVGDIKADTRVSGPRLLAQFCRKLGNVVPVNDCIVWIIQHLIANTSGYGPAFSEDGGNKIQYQEDVKIRAKKEQPWMVGSGENQKKVGQIIPWTMLTSALGGISGSTTDSYLRYGYGIDELKELITICCNLGMITVAGSWFTYEGINETVKVQGSDKLYEYFVTHPEDREKLNNEFRSLMGWK